ncbi:MAG: VaFE repeat-containing surface-anchored protein, partial [Atopobiaceae bacterium]|nr:VaFE repeat-containing surface-anchored protein [Atopobiaceae bacterium]
MRTRRQTYRPFYLPHWGNGPAKKAGSIALTAILVLSNLLTGLSPAIAYAEEAGEPEAVVELVDESTEAPVAIVDELAAEPEVIEASEDVVEEPEAPAIEGEADPADANAPPAEPDEDALPEVPATVDVEYRIVEGEDETVMVEPAAAIVGDPMNRIELKTDFGIEEGRGFSIEVKVELEGVDIADKVEMPADRGRIDVPVDIDLAKVSVEVIVTIDAPEAASDTVPESPVAEGTDDGPAPEATAEDPAAPAGEEEAADVPAGEGDLDAAPMVDLPAYNEQMGIIEDYLDGIEATDVQRQYFMMAYGAPMLAAAAQTGTITYVGDTGLYDGIATKEYWEMDGNVAYCISSFLASPSVGDTFTYYGTASQLGIPALDYVLYHGWDGDYVTSVGGLDREKSIVATQAAVWAVVADKARSILDWTAQDGSNIFSNDNWYNRVPGLAVNYPDASRAAQQLLDAANAWASGGAAGPERDFAKIYLNSGRGHDADGLIYQHMVMLGDRAGKLTLRKASSNPTLTESLPGCYSLAGAVYGVYSDSACTAQVATLTTDASGSTNTVELAAGTYWVKEISPSPGFYIDQSTYQVTVEAGKTATVSSTEVPGNDPAVFRVRKRDRDTGQESPLGKGTLEGAEFTIKYYDNVDGSTAGSPTRTWVVRTNSDGYTRLRQEFLVSGSDPLYMFGSTAGIPVGTITVQETKAPAGYIATSSIHTQVITIDDTATGVTELNDVIVDEQVKRGDVRWVKLDSDGNPMADVTFRITNSAGEYVDVKTDANGVFDSSRPADKAQAWMPQGTTVDNDLGAFPYDSYTVHELRTEGVNQDMILVGDFSFTVDDSTANITQDLGLKVNRPIEIATTLIERRGGHYVSAMGPITLIDTIAYSGVEPGDTYWFTGELMDKETGESLGITATGDEFTPERRVGTEDMAYTLDAATVRGKTIVCFEELHMKGDDEFIVVHKDIDDVDQTVYVPDLGTTLADGAGDQEVLVTEDITLTDTVAYTNLEPGVEHTVTGELMDKATGKSTGITASTTFTPTEKDGEVEVAFTFKGVEVSGKTVVAFETVERDGKTWAVHADIDDQNQTVNFPEISTTMVDRDGEHESLVADETVTLTDTVEYKALRPGEAYTMQAELIDKDTEDVIATAETEFVPEAADGTVDVVFEVARADVEGKVTVCFETLVREGREVAIHADIEDAGQTVNFPSGGTTLTDAEGNHEVLATENLALTDTIEYQGLIPGKTYSVRGELMDKETGEATGIVSGASFTPEASFGTVTIEFTFDGVEMAG